MAKHRVLKNLAIDIICAGLGLTAFALFHHVLPRQQQSMGIVISQESQAEAPASTPTPARTEAPRPPSSPARPPTAAAGRAPAAGAAPSP